MRRKLLFVFLAALIALAIVGVASAGNGGFAPAPSPVSPNAKRIDDTYWFIFGFCAFIFVAVEGALLLFVVRYRQGRRPRSAEGPQIRGNERLELLWTALPVVILACIGGFIFYKMPGIKNTPSARAAGPAGRMDVEVQGHRYYWEFKYRNGVVAIDRLRAPLGTVMALRVTAPASDVIHSWWIPDLGGKTDAIPGHPNHTWFSADRIGVYEGQCSEFCGIQHAAMLATVEVMPKDAFDRWLSAEAAAQHAGKSDLGKQTFVGVCAKCHGLAAEGMIGPRLKGNPLLNDRKGLELVVREGRGLMPPVGQDWDDAQMTALYDYIHAHYGGKGGASGG